MRVTINKSGGLQILADSEFEVDYLRNIGVHITGNLHLEHDEKNCYLDINKKQEESE